jgi:hypothetical protein
MTPETLEKIVVRQSPEVQAIIRALHAENAMLRARIDELERQRKRGRKDILLFCSARGALLV